MAQPNPRRSDLTAREVIDQHVRRWERRGLKDAWARRQADAWRAGPPLAGLIEEWGRYADDYFERYGSSIADDGVLGTDGWLPIGEGLLALLNGELGALHGMSLDSLIRDLLANEGEETGV